VIRPQDLATKGDGSIIYKGDPLYLHGKDTTFKQQVGPRDIIVLSKTLKAEVVEVLSDTELKLKAPLSEDAIQHLQSEDIAYKVIPHVDQSVLYEKVHERLDQNECIVIFPEGGSHDRTEMLPLKGKLFILEGFWKQNNMFFFSRFCYHGVECNGRERTLGCKDCSRWVKLLSSPSIQITRRCILWCTHHDIQRDGQ
jgi:hypothetical protein